MRLKLAAVAALTAVIFSSCDKNMSEEWGNLPDGSSTTPGTGGSNLSNSSTCKNCVYYPTCSGSAYRYSDTSFGSSTPTTVNYTLQYVKDTVMESKIYQKMSGTGQQNSYYNCTNGVSSSIVLNGTTNGGSTIPYVKITNLKANEPVGASWADVITNQGGQPSTYTYTIVSKGGTRTVAGTNYTDVIHIHEQTTIEVSGFGSMNAGRSDYYFAKNKGLIESISFDDFSGIQLLHHVLVSVTIP